MSNVDSADLLQQALEQICKSRLDDYAVVKGIMRAMEGRQSAEIERLQAISDAAEDLIAYRGNVREDEMWAKLHDALFPPTCKSGEEEESK